MYAKDQVQLSDQFESSTGAPLLAGFLFTIKQSHKEAKFTVYPKIKIRSEIFVMEAIEVELRCAISS